MRAEEPSPNFALRVHSSSLLTPSPFPLFSILLDWLEITRLPNPITISHSVSEALLKILDVPKAPCIRWAL